LADLLHTDLGVGPVLVIQGGLDQTVDWKYNLDIIDKLFPDSRVEYLPGAGHQLANESDSLRQRYYRVIDEYLGLRPATGHREAGQPAAGPDAD
jgi:lysophospholipase